MHNRKERAAVNNEAILIAYFSHSGNTQVIANQIHQCAGGDLFRIATIDPYPADYDTVVEAARKELRNGSRPKLSEQVVNIASYGVVFIGYPCWWSTMPMAVFSFLEQHELSGKKIAPFCTHEGSGLGRSVQDIRKLCPQSVIQDGLAVRGGSVAAAKKDVQVWLGRIGMIEE